MVPDLCFLKTGLALYTLLICETCRREQTHSRYGRQLSTGSQFDSGEDTPRTSSGLWAGPVLAELLLRKKSLEQYDTLYRQSCYVTMGSEYVEEHAQRGIHRLTGKWFAG